MVTKKHIKITGISNISWKDATLKAINEVSKTIDLISDVNVLNIGSEKIIENINQKENSYSKAYEICKNTTI